MKCFYCVLKLPIYTCLPKNTGKEIALLPSKLMLKDFEYVITRKPKNQFHTLSKEKAQPQVRQSPLLSFEGKENKKRHQMSECFLETNYRPEATGKRHQMVKVQIGKHIMRA
ncbi:unnamed protein product [Camellia sinensis]